MKPLSWTVGRSPSVKTRTRGARADAILTGSSNGLEGWGRARRNRADPEMPAVGEEIAAARALSDLSHHLLEQAAHNIESWEGHPIHLNQ